MCDCTVATILVVYVLFISTNFLTDVNDFLSLLLIWIGPFAGVWLVDGTLRRWKYDPLDIHAVREGSAGRYWGWHGINVKGFVSMLIGAVVCVLTIDSPILEGPISKSLSGSDLTWLLGPLVARHHLLRNRPGRRQGKRSDSIRPPRARAKRWARLGRSMKD